MKRLGFVVLFAVSFCFVADVSAQVQKVNVSQTNPFVVYKDFANKNNHFYPSGWTGDYGDIHLSQNCPDACSGTSCIKITYTAKASQGARWAAIYFMHPENTWGNLDKGYNLTGAAKLTFWARGEEGGETVSHFKVGGVTGNFSDTDQIYIGPVKLTKEWKQYTIDLTGMDLSRISGGFCLAFSRDDNPNGLVMYLDEIVYQ